MEESMTKQENVWVTKVEQIDGAVAVDVPPALFEKLQLKDGDRIVWILNDDNTFTISNIRK
jgi:antitoxin component of MazEF toxin-antitoxin module